ncbi:MAG: PIN domain-containing protein [Streptosporangiaceae bacterium]
MPFTVVYDANALVGNTQRDLLFQVALAGLVQAKFSERIVDETIAAVHKSRPGHRAGAPEKLDRLRGLMLSGIPDSIVSGHEPLIEGLQLRDPDDRHVLKTGRERITDHAEYLWLMTVVGEVFVRAGEDGGLALAGRRRGAASISWDGPRWPTSGRTPLLTESWSA